MDLDLWDCFGRKKLRLITEEILYEDGLVHWSNFSNGHCDLILLKIFFVFISINIKVLLIHHAKFQPNIPSRSGENDDFISFAIFSNGDHLEFYIAPC